jgi:hypothetical protein
LSPWDEMTGGWKKQHNKNLHNSYSSLNIIRMIKLRYTVLGNESSDSIKGGEFINYPSYSSHGGLCSTEFFFLFSLKQKWNAQPTT